MDSSFAGSRRPFRREWFVQLCHFFLVSLAVALVLSVLAIVLSVGFAHAGTWVPVGAPGGNVRALAADPRDPQRIYLGTADGILYRSDNGGTAWKRLSPGFPLRGCSLDEIVVDRRGVVFVGYWEVHGKGGGVARSGDGGRTFTVLKGIEGESVRALALAPSNDRIVAAGTLTGVFLSRDGGSRWARITPAGHPDLRNIESLAFDPADPRTIYAGTWHLVWSTGNAGREWQPAHQGIIDDSDVMTLTVDSRHPEMIYATACTGIYRTTDKAAEWTKLRGIPFSSRRTRAFAQGADDPDLLIAGTTEGLWVSDDRGGTWRLTTSKQLVVNSVIAQPDGSILLGTEEAGVLRSSDRGLTWASSNTGFSERFVFRLLFDADGRRMIAAVWGASRFGGVFVSQGVGGRWVRLGTGLDGRQVLSLALRGRTILAGTDEGIFARGPEATSWSRIGILLAGKEARPRVTELLALSAGRFLAATPNGLIRSLDAGKTWEQALEKNDEVFDLAVSGEDGDLVAAATRSGFFVSNNGGENWRQVSDSLDVTPHALVFDPADSRVLFTTTSGGLYRSGDQGATWLRVNGGLPHSDLTGIAFQPDGRTLYVSDFTWGGIFRSTDSGSTWSRMSTDGLGSDKVWTLGVDPEAPERLLAGASAGGLHLLVPSRGSSTTSTSAKTAD